MSCQNCATILEDPSCENEPITLDTRNREWFLALPKEEQDFWLGVMPQNERKAYQDLLTEQEPTQEDMEQ